MDLTQFFNPSAWGSWSQPNQSMVGPKPAMPMAGGGGGPAQPGVMPAQPPMNITPNAGGGFNPISMMLGPYADKFNASPAGQRIESIFNRAPQGMMGGISGNPMLAKFGAAMMGGQNPMQALAQNPGDFVKWMQMRRQAQPGVQANPVGNPQPPVPTMRPGMLGGLY